MIIIFKGGAPKLKAIALDSLTFALLTFPRDDFNLNLVAKLVIRDIYLSESM